MCAPHEDALILITVYRPDLNRWMPNYKTNEERKMKRCYICGGDIEKRIVDVEVEGVIVKAVPAEVCTRCGEEYFNTKAATFVQKVTRYVNEVKKRYLIDVFNP